MFTIFADNDLIYDSRIEDYVIASGKITKEVNKSGSFVFSMFPDNPFYNRIVKLKTIITVYKSNEIIFRGRAIEESIGFYNDKTFTCEGELSFLLDSIQRPYNFTGTPAELLEQFIRVHNSQVDESKRFQIGQITVTDPNDYITRSDSAYTDTLTCVNKKLVELLGGYLHVTRGANNVPILNYFEDYPYESGQVIEFGENLLDFTKVNDGGDIATAIIPLGAKIGEGDDAYNLTIESVNEGLDYIYDQTAVNTYGWIFKVVTWNDVTVATNLLNKARAYLNESINQNITLELSAVDLSLLDQSIDSFTIGDYISIVSKPHGVNARMLLKKQTLDLLKPGNDTITLGYTYSAFTDRALINNTDNATLLKTVETIEGNYVTNTTVVEEVETLRSLIDQTSTAISTEILSEYATNDELISSISTLYTQLNDIFEFRFNTIDSKVDENDIESRREFERISKYIRFEDGNIILGESGNELTLKIENDKISFYEGSTEVAYVSNQKLYITDAEILASLRIGNFSFIPRANGNLSFKKVGGV